MECERVKELFAKLVNQPRHQFPQKRKRWQAPTRHGVYIIRKDETVLHVGRTLRGKDGLRQRLQNHASGSSSFTKSYLKGNGGTLRQQGYTYQYLEEEHSRLRALLEAYAVGTLCPEHIGLGDRVA